MFTGALQFLLGRKGSGVCSFRIEAMALTLGAISIGGVDIWKKAVRQAFSGLLVLFLRKRLQISEIFLTRPRVS